ncbi:hypothetical protein [Shinella granuli]|uniref:Uncharacterized protein n=1 Tax=Shinella granuli TaxID=323621 RepID=A0A4R2C810_SHIGR|nr:hypothetical protein [Shinella granuli]TCN34959.1 hypothetical protein EV665_13140 [Shinella granuli]
MTHDLVERLREMGSVKTSALYFQRKTLNGAADLIEKLERENAALRAEKDEIRKAAIEEAANLAENATIFVQHDWAAGPVSMPIDHRKNIAAAIRNMGDRE